jgi:hypothetical protein
MPPAPPAAGPESSGGAAESLLVAEALTGGTVLDATVAVVPGFDAGEGSVLVNALGAGEPEVATTLLGGFARVVSLGAFCVGALTTLVSVGSGLGAIDCEPEASSDESSELGSDDEQATAQPATE